MNVCTPSTHGQCASYAGVWLTISHGCKERWAVCLLKHLWFLHILTVKWVSSTSQWGQSNSVTIFHPPAAIISVISLPTHQHWCYNQALLQTSTVPKNHYWCCVLALSSLKKKKSIPANLISSESYFWKIYLINYNFYLEENRIFIIATLLFLLKIKPYVWAWFPLSERRLSA